MNRLSPDHLPAAATLPGYDRDARGIGIVHFGLGAFARAHLGWYTDHAMAVAGGDWRIAGVSMRSTDVEGQLAPQDGLYCVAERAEGPPRLQLIGSLAAVHLAGRDAPALVDRLAAPGTHIASFTVTEKGYCRSADGGLDMTLAAVGFYPILAAGLAKRRAAGLRGLTLLSCDNLADNGRQLQRLLGAWLAAHDPELLPWVEAECRFPGTMVDRIVPATTVEDRDTLAALLGVRDEGLVVTEPFSQWVIADDFAGPRPAWDRVGAQLVADVTPYETAKLRLLNGAHSALAYCGLIAGHAHVHEAIADPGLRPLIDSLMREEAAPTIAAAPGQDLDAYASALLVRFANPALAHRLIQIAMDGSQKLPQRWLPTLAANQRAGRRCPAILAGISAWLRHIRGDNRCRWGAVSDPLADRLAATWQTAGRAGIVPALFGAAGLLASDWQPDAEDVAMILMGLPE